MQEPNESKDAELVQKVSDYLSGKTPLGGGASGNNAAPGSAPDFGGLDQNQLLAMLTGQAPIPTPSTGATSGTTPAQQSQPQPSAQAMADNVPASLTSILDPDQVIPILEADQSAMDALLPHLPR